LPKAFRAAILAAKLLNESLRVPAEAMPEADATPVISYQARSYNVFDEQTKDAAV
jgi:hypothetical protein